MSDTKDSAETLFISGVGATPVRSQTSHPEQSSSPRASPVSRALKVEFDLPTTKSSSPISLPEEFLTKPDTPALLPTRPKSYVSELQRPRITSSLSTPKMKMSSPRSYPQASWARQLVPYPYPLRQMQPSQSILPSPKCTVPKPVRLQVARNGMSCQSPPRQRLSLRPPSPLTPKELQKLTRPDPLRSHSSAENFRDSMELVYNIRTDTFFTKPRAVLLPRPFNSTDDTPTTTMSRDDPALLVDGRVNIIELKNWEHGVDLWWRVFDGDKYRVLKKRIELPAWYVLILL